jgi:hypothetical protein
MNKEVFKGRAAMILGFIFVVVFLFLFADGSFSFFNH